MQPSVTLACYPAGWGQDEHVDIDDGFSVLIAGRLTEASHGTTVSVAPGQSVVKPGDAPHRTRFNRESIVIKFETPGLFPRGEGAVGWQWLSSRRTAAGLLAALRILRDRSPTEAVDHLRDLIPDAEAGPAPGEPPGWLQRAHEELADRAHEGVSVAEVAAAVGLHPVHLSRVYRRHYGMAPSEALQRFRLGRAIRAATSDGEPLAMAAASGGFSDQSHLTRVCRRFLGVTPREATRSATGPTQVGSVQSPRLTLLYPPVATA